MIMPSCRTSLRRNGKSSIHYKRNSRNVVPATRLCGVVIASLRAEVHSTTTTLPRHCRLPSRLALHPQALPYGQDSMLRTQVANTGH